MFPEARNQFHTLVGSRASATACHVPLGFEIASCSFKWLLTAAGLLLHASFCFFVHMQSVRSFLVAWTEAAGTPCVDVRREDRQLFPFAAYCQSQMSECRGQAQDGILGRSLRAK